MLIYTQREILCYTLYIKIIDTRLVWLVECVARTIEVIHAYSCLVGSVKIRRALGRLRHRWEDNIKLSAKEITCKMIDRNVFVTRLVLSVVWG